MYDFIVPQELNISDRIGKFTFTQIGFLASSLLIIIGLIMSENINIWVKVLVGFPVAFLGIYLAFVTKYGLPIYKFLIIKLQYTVSPKEMMYSLITSSKEIEDADYEYYHQEDTLDPNVMGSLKQNIIFD